MSSLVVQEQGELKFEVDAGLLFQLGEQLVARRSIALGELVKNAYDADATEAIVRLQDVTKPNGTIIVEDNGIGMTLEDIRDHWMRIATDNKLQHALSPVYGRPLAGAKGVGRFAARRLSRSLVLISVAQRADGSRERVTAKFDWECKFKAGKTLTEIPVKYRSEPVPPHTATGVILRLESVRDVWDRADVQGLRRDLVSLISPYPPSSVRSRKQNTTYKRDPGFDLRIDSREFPEQEGGLTDEFLSAAWGVLNGRVDPKGVSHYHLHIHSRQQGAGERLSLVSDETLKDLTGATLKVHYFVYQKQYFQDVPFGPLVARHVGRQRGGIRIYMDGFRVFPYGERGDDWLGLDELAARRLEEPYGLVAQLKAMASQVWGRPFLTIPGNNRVFGYVAVSRLNQPKIQINISRERVIENEAFDQLRRFLLTGIYWATIQYARVTASERQRRASERQRKRESRRSTATEVIKDAMAKIEQDVRVPEESRTDVLQLLAQARDSVEAEREEHISALSMLRVLSSTGAAIAVIQHQFRAVVEGARHLYVDLAELESSVSKQVWAQLQDMANSSRQWYELVNEQMSQLESLLGKEARHRRRRLVLRSSVDKVARPFSLYMDDYGIDFDNQVPRHMRTPPVFPAELHAVVLHLLTNSLKAVLDKEVRKIAVQAERDGKALRIRVLDTGRGVEPEKREEVFQPFVTDSNPDPILGVGTGLGLWVVRSILDSYGGSAQFIDIDEEWSTCVELVLPYVR